MRITFNLVYKAKRQRFYESSLPLKKSALTDKYTLRELMLKEKQTLIKEDMHLIPDDIEGVSLLCISDARTHTERLVFAALKTDKGEYGRIRLQIDGKHTFMIHGGNIDSVYDDEVYLRHLSKLSGYIYTTLLKDTK